MAKRSLSTTSLTPAAVADTIAYTNNGYCGTIVGAGTTQRTNIIEVYLGGQAGASSPTFMMLARDSTISSTLVVGSTFDVPLDAAAATSSLASVGNSSTATPPQRSATGHLLNLSFNAFGGIVRWVAAPGEEITIVGNGASLGSISLSAYTGGVPGLLGSHIIYETV